MKPATYVLTQKQAVALLLAAMAAALSGCIIIDDGGGSGPDPDVPGGTLVIDNRSDFAIREVNLAAVGSDVWGPNLIAGDILAPQESIAIATPCDHYDVRVLDPTGAECVLVDVDLCFDDAYWRIDNDTLFACGWDPISQFTIVNDSDYAIHEAYLTPVSAASWGPELLGGYVLGPGQEISVDAYCDYYDVLIVDAYGSECILSAIDLCGSDATWRVTNDTLAACGFDPVGTLTIVNESQYTLYAVYVTEVSAPDWGPDVLGNEILGPGDSIEIELSCGRYDVLIVDEFAIECPLYDLSICTGDTYWYVTDADLVACEFASFGPPESRPPID